jgi:hypothetical protein
MLRIYDRQSRFYGFAIVEVHLPKDPELEMAIDMEKRIIYVNKSAREGANVVLLNACGL